MVLLVTGGSLAALHVQSIITQEHQVATTLLTDFVTAYFADAQTSQILHTCTFGVNIQGFAIIDVTHVF